MMIRFVAVALLLAPSVSVAQKSKSAAPLDVAAIDKVVTSAMTEWKVPGVAVGVIKDGKVLLAKGYGYRDVEQKLPVTAQTILAIGSNSKSFTAVLLGMLVDEKKLSWDEPVRTYLPDFQLYDEYATRHMTPRDLVTHRSGLPRHDMAWYGRKATRKELMSKLRYLEPTHSFREVWQYQNLMFMAAGYLSEQLTGKAWETLVKERIFEPLGMTRSNTSVKDSPNAGDFAWPYDLVNGVPTRVPFRSLDAVGPAGSINSSVEDMLKYVDWRIRQGEWGGKQLIAKATEQDMQSGHMVVGGMANLLWGGFSQMAYGLGVGVGFYRGHPAVIHGGGIDGFISQMSWLPEAKTGVVVLTNLGGANPVPMIVVRSIYDRILGLTPTDWAAEQRKLDQIQKQQEAKARTEAEANRVKGTSPSHPLADYAGTYEHPGYGRLVIRTAGDGLEAALDDVSIKLGHWHYDVFRGSQDLPVNVTFGIGAKGEIATVSIPFEAGIAPIVFTRK